MTIALSLAPRFAAAQPEEEQESPPAAAVRAYAGLGSGAGAELWVIDRVRADVDLGTLTVTPWYWAGAGLAVRVAGSSRHFVGVRGGYQLELEEAGGNGTWSGSRSAHALDAGLIARVESPRGSAIEAQVGAEQVFRSTAAICCDDGALATHSTGFRAGLLGELALSDSLALFARAGLRTADHVLEIRCLPTLSLGVRYRL